MLFMLLLIPLTILFGRQIAPWIIPGLMAGLLGFGAARGVRVYESFGEGARDGFQVAVRIIPYLVAILVAVGMLRESGALDLLIRPIGATTAPLGLPAEALLMGIPRAVRLRRIRLSRFGVERSGNRPRQLYRLSRQHHSGLDRDDLLRSRGLLRRGWRRTYAACRARWPHSRRCRPARFGLKTLF